MDKKEIYLVRRVKQLLAEGWEHSRIVQQLEALGGKKKIQRLIEQVSISSKDRATTAVARFSG